MNKYIKFSTLFITSLLLILSTVSYAEETSKEDTSIKNKVTPMQKIREEREKERQERQEKQNEEFGINKEFKNRIENKEVKEEIKTKVEKLLEEVKTKRAEFKAEIVSTKEEIKAKMVEARASFKAELSKIKDEKKKVLAENIFNNIGNLNILITDKMADKIDQIESVLLSVESRISKAKDRGVDVSSVSDDVVKAKTAIEEARKAVALQAKNTYTTTITDDAKLKAEMQTLRDKLKIDLKTANDKVKSAHEAVRFTAVALAKISNIDDDKEVEKDDDASGTPNN